MTTEQGNEYEAVPDSVWKGFVKRNDIRNLPLNFELLIMRMLGRPILDESLRMMRAYRERLKSLDYEEIRDQEMWALLVFQHGLKEAVPLMEEYYLRKKPKR